MRFVPVISAVFCLIVSFGAPSPAHADVVGTALLNDVNGHGLPDLSDAAAIHVTLNHFAAGNGGPDNDAYWEVAVVGGTKFREFLFNFDTTLDEADVVPIGLNASSWHSESGLTPSTGTFGKFGFEVEANSTNLSSLLFTILVDGNFDPNGKGIFFAAKIASSGPGGFVAAHSISPVPLPAAVWVFITGIAGIGALAARRRKLLALKRV